MIDGMELIESIEINSGRWKTNESAILACLGISWHTFWHETTEPKGMVEGIEGNPK